MLGLDFKIIPPQIGLEGWWKLGEGSGSVANDSSGNGETASLVNSPTWVLGASGYALDFASASNQYAVTPPVEWLPSSGLFTISCWINPSGTQAAWAGIVTLANNDANEPAEVKLTYNPSNQPFIQIVSSGGVFVRSSFGSIPAGSWSHLVATYDGTNLNAYLNGVLASSAASAKPTASVIPLYIGSDGTISGRYLNGAVEDVRIWNRALSAAEVLGLYSSIDAPITFDYTDTPIRIKITRPATTGVPTCDVVLNNQDGRYAKIPLYGVIEITLPRLPPQYFRYETPTFSRDEQEGHTVELAGTCAPELTNLTEGNLAVVGTDLPVSVWGSSPVSSANATYAPYSSKYVTGLGSNLLDIGDLLTALLHTKQPNQKTGFRGRLGYDCTGLGLNSLQEIDYTGGSLGAFIKGMWQVGLGSTGSQKTGIDILRDVVTKNIIDGGTVTGIAGTPLYYDFYVDTTQSPPQLRVLQRGSVSSGAVVTMGSSLIRDLKLPVDTQDVKDFVLYWANKESQYPTGDAWSNYSTGADLLAAWGFFLYSGSGKVGVSADTSTTVNATSSASQFVLYVASVSGFLVGTPVIINQNGTTQETAVIASIQTGSTPSLTMRANLAYNHYSGETVVEYVSRYNSGTSIQFTNLSTSSGAVFTTTGLNLQTLNQRVLNVPNQSITSLNLSLLRTISDTSGYDQLVVTLIAADGTSAIALLTHNSGAGLPSISGSGVWQDISIPIQSSGLGDWSDGGTGGKTFNFALANIVNIIIQAYLGYDNTTQQVFFLDQIHFSDDWDFSPVYSYNTTGATATPLSASAAAGSTTLHVLSTAGLVIGQQLTIDFANPNQESVDLTGISAGVLTVSPALVNSHNAVEVNTTDTDYPGSIPGQPVVSVNSTTGFVVGAIVIIDAGTPSMETLTIKSVNTSASTLTFTTNLVYFHNGTGVAGVTPAVVTQLAALVIGATHNPQSIGSDPILAGLSPAYGLRIFNWVDFYTSSGGSDEAGLIAQSILNSRMGKKSSGTVELDGYDPAVPLITPGSRFKIASAEDVYIGGGIDSAIDSWIADEIRYDYTAEDGFLVTIVVEPYYAVIFPNSPDTNRRNLWRTFGRTPELLISRLERGTQQVSPQP